MGPAWYVRVRGCGQSLCKSSVCELGCVIALLSGDFLRDNHEVICVGISLVEIVLLVVFVSGHVDADAVVDDVGVAVVEAADSFITAVCHVGRNGQGQGLGISSALDVVGPAHGGDADAGGHKLVIGVAECASDTAITHGEAEFNLGMLHAGVADLGVQLLQVGGSGGFASLTGDATLAVTLSVQLLFPLGNLGDLGGGLLLAEAENALLLVVRLLVLCHDIYLLNSAI